MTDTAPSFPTLLQRFFVDHLRQQRAVSPCTVAAYRDTFKLLLAFAEKRIGKSPTDVTLPDLNADLILAFLDHLERERANSVRSRNARLSAIRVFLKYAAHEDLTALAVIERSLAVPQKRHDKPVLGYLTRPEVHAIINAPDPKTWAGRRDRALFAFLYNTGARVSEAINLQVGSVILETAPVVHLHGKGRKRRSVPLWNETARTLKRWIQDLRDCRPDAYLFPNSSGGRLSRSSVRQRLDLAVDTAGRDVPISQGESDIATYLPAYDRNAPAAVRRRPYCDRALARARGHKHNAYLYGGRSCNEGGGTQPASAGHRNWRTLSAA